LTGSKFFHGDWCQNEADGVDLLMTFLAEQRVSSLMVAGVAMMLMVMICSWHSWLHRMYVFSWWLELE
jgi:hypothetical protein